MLSILSFVATADATTPLLNSVEQGFLAKSGRQSRYPGEYIQVIEVNNQLELGQLTALSFLKWIEEHPESVIAVSVGKTSSSFSKYLRWYKDHWHDPVIQSQLHSYGILSKDFPSGEGLKFVQVAEFYPISPTQVVSFHHYIKENYLSLFNIAEKNLLLMDLSHGILKSKGSNVVFRDGKVDLSLLYRKPRNRAETWQKQALQEAKAYCRGYEQTITQWGGIDLFIGRIGVDGHIAFNMPGSSFNSETRLARLSDMTAAQVSDDLAGMPHARSKVMMTIGLGTILKNPNVKIIVLGAGSNKAKLAQSAIEQPADVELPFSILQNSPHSRLYLTHAAAQTLTARRQADIQQALNGPNEAQMLNQIAIDIALQEQTPLLLLTKKQLLKYPQGKIFLKHVGQQWYARLQAVHQHLVDILQKGVQAKENNKFVHIAPQQDDLLLTYYAALSRTFSKNYHQFVYLRDGAHQVADDYLLDVIEQVNDWLLHHLNHDIFKTSYPALLEKFSKAYEEDDEVQVKQLELVIILKHLAQVFQLKNEKALNNQIRWLKDEYFPKKIAEESDTPLMREFKSRVRQSEVDRIWTIKGIPLARISHLQAKFSAMDFSHLFEVDPQQKQKLLNLCLQIHPDVVSVVDNSMAEGADIHFWVLQMMADVLSKYPEKSKLKVWGYRNTGQHYRFDESNLLIPVTRQELKDKKRLFYRCFSSQKAIMSGCPHTDMDSAVQSTNVQKNQLQQLKVLLGESFFSTHPDAQIKNASGLVMLRQMDLPEFLAHTRAVQEAMGPLVG